MYKRKIYIFLFLLFLSHTSIFSFSGLGSGTPIDPFEITTCEELQEMEDDLWGSYELRNNIDCSSISNFRRIGTCNGTCFWSDVNDLRFGGTFNGNNFIISNLNIVNSTTSDDGWGLFGFARQTSISNVTLSNIFINVSSNAIGGLVGYSGFGLDISEVGISGEVYGIDDVGGISGYGTSNSDISNSIFSGHVEGNDSVGGIIGESGTDTNGVSGSSSSALIIANNNVGGILGMGINTIISTSYFSGSVNGNGSVGGITGLSFLGQINDVHFSGSINGSGDVGGIVGVLGSTINNSFSSGEITANTFVGGFVGQMMDLVSSQILNSFSISNVSGVNISTTGAMIGNFGGGTLTNNYWNNISGNPNSAFGFNSSSGTNVIQDNLSYFYDISNPPLNGWDTNIWDFTGANLPSLIGVGPVPTSSINSVSSLFPSGSIYIPLSLMILYLLF